MPAFVLVALGALGAVALARVITAETRRINEALDRHRAADTGELETIPLERDPVTGDYRPRKN
ncbi:hypothetical protein EZH22_16360 [Xanthobacter dioxanivorans]|uniref:Uncharacterized protein n=1 Tax=Xanthobacter dioxanivorans TaxID=2528964 RepID=A0A974SH44_9HYPH|nr:hypothetical protein [Xanthobacter dioxanivorans]QRG04734.1 hypothetical protein EZH22_16360 [Xanthobacter dioxanivorans]